MSKPSDNNRISFGGFYNKIALLTAKTYDELAALGDPMVKHVLATALRLRERTRGSPKGIRPKATGRVLAAAAQAHIAAGVGPFAAFRLVAAEYSVDKNKVKKAHYQYPNNSDN